MFRGNDLQFILVYLPIILLSLTFHEIAHGFAAYKLGDLTAKNDGRLSLNPIRHIDPIGLIVLLVARIGWAKPVMINPNNLENPKKDMAIISLAGPLTNLLLSVLFFIPWFILNSMESPPNMPAYFYALIEAGVYLNVVLAVFNLLPIPPLDGSKIIGSLLPDHLYYKIVHNSRIGMLVLIILVFTGVFSQIIFPMVSSVIKLYEYAAGGIIKLFF